MEAGLRSHEKILGSDWSPSLLVEELACRHVGQDKLFFQKRCLVCQKLCRNIVFGQSNGKVHDTDMSLI